MITALGTYALINSSEDGVESIGVIGELDLASAHDFESAVNSLDAAAPAIAIDLSGCRYIDSSIITVLLRATRRFGKRLTIVVPEDSQLRRIFNVLNLDAALPIEPSIGALGPSGP